MRTEPISGPAAVAQPVPPDLRDTPREIATYLLDPEPGTPRQQRVVCVRHLRPLAGHPAARKHYPGATHQVELLKPELANLNPATYRDRLLRHFLAHNGTGLEPLVSVQVQLASDEAACALARALACLVVQGTLPLDPDPVSDDAHLWGKAITAAARGHGEGAQDEATALEWLATMLRASAPLGTVATPATPDAGELIGAAHAAATPHQVVGGPNG